MTNASPDCSQAKWLLTSVAAAILTALFTTSGDAVAQRSDASPAAPTSRPSTPQGSFEVVEWVILMVDPNRPNANDAGAFKSTLPGFARGRRDAVALPSVGATPASSAAPQVDALRQPSPVGVIRLINRGGEAASEDLIDVLIQAPSGRFLGYWPAGKPRSGRQLWEGVQMRERAAKPVPADVGHWFETLRAGKTPVSTGKWSEQFLMYDAELKYPNVLRVKAAPDGAMGAYQIGNAGPAAVRDVEVYVPAEGGWHVAGLKELPAATPAPETKPATTTTTAPSTQAAAEVLKQVFEEGASGQKPAAGNRELQRRRVLQGAAPAATQPASQPATQASTRPATQPAVVEDLPKDAWRDVKMPAGAKALPPADALAAWRTRFNDAGLTAGDVEVILATLRTHALDSEQLTVVYRLDPAELDRLLPLEVVPQPARITRVGLAIVRNIDPAAGERIAKLIEQLGSPDWDTREAAHAKLAELGAGAKPKLTEAQKHKDVEVVHRAERLLEALSNP